MMLRLELTGVSKQYPAVRACDGVNLRVKPGEIHAVLGENGAGKSTLMKVIVGAVQPDEGRIRFNGQTVAVASPAQARALGISMVHQHFSLFDTLTAAENVWLGLDKSLKLAAVTRRIDDLARRHGLDVDPLRPVHSLSVGERQRVEIVRALLTEPQLLILDEPTSVLTPQAVDKRFVTLRLLSEQGCSILYISHKLDEICALCHHCTVLRGGQVTGEVTPAEETNASLSRLMIGAEPAPLQRRPAQTGPDALQVRGLSLPCEQPFGTALQDIHFDVRAGEIDARLRLLIVSQPTWGVDVGAAALIRGELLALRDAGCALLVVSEELGQAWPAAVYDRQSLARVGTGPAGLRGHLHASLAL